ncbi:MAG: protein kinase [Labilithrix sp.]|nr:protein kinase [Labilithrix sp.]MCW5812982.1 protein kinase [Labilithrix sp.]
MGGTMRRSGVAQTVTDSHEQTSPAPPVAPYAAQALTPAPPATIAAAPLGATIAQGPAAQTVSSVLAPGVVVADRYVLEREIGSGATAVVWRVHDRQLRRDVALKVFFVDDVHGRKANEVSSEAQASSWIRSDHVVRIHNACVDAKLGIVAIDMELCAEFGDDGAEHFATELGALVPRARPTHAEVREAARWVMEAALGVHSAHTRNVFHRDLKPANVLVSHAARRAQVADFGLAAYEISRPDEAGPAKARTVAVDMSAGRFLAGTPEYMAPEQARGVPRLDPDGNPQHRALLQGIDVYGLGAVLFELLAGHAPHDAGPDADVMTVVAKAAANQVPFDALARRRVPRRLRAIVRRALDTDPTKRFATAKDMAAALRAFLDDRPFPGERGLFGALYLAGRRHPGLVASVVASMLFLALTIGLSTWRLRALDAELDDGDRRLAALEAETTRKQQEITDLQKRIVENQETARQQAQAAAESAQSLADSLRKKAETAGSEAERQKLLLRAKEASLQAEKEHGKELVAQHETEVAQLRFEREMALNEQKLKHQQETTKLHTEQAQSIQQLRDEHAKEKQRIEGEHAKEIARLNADHATAMKQTDESYRRDIKRVEDERDKLRARVAQLESAPAPTPAPAPVPTPTPGREEPPRRRLPPTVR